MPGPDFADIDVLDALVERVYEQYGIDAEDGLDEEEIDEWCGRHGVALPAALRAVLAVVNGAFVRKGTLLGVDTERASADIARPLGLYASWRASGWLPVGNDGCGNHYVSIPFRGSWPVAYVECDVDSETPAFVAASGPVAFTAFLIDGETGTAYDTNGYARWPFEAGYVLARDPALEGLRDLAPLPWEVDAG